MSHSMGVVLRSVLALIVVGSVVTVVVLPLIQAPPTSGGITIDPSTVFRPSASWTEIHFASPQTFLVEVNTGPSSVTFDGVSIEVEKIPRRLPRAQTTITVWEPRADTATTALEFVTESEHGDTMWLNITGLRADAVYDIYFDAAWQSRSRDPGGIIFSWSFSTSHTIKLVAYVDTIDPVAIAVVKQAASVGEILNFDGTGSYDDSGVVRHEWAFGDGTIALGASVQHAYRAEGYYAVTLSVWDTVGNSGSTSLAVQVTPPTSDSMQPASVVDLRALAVGPDYIVLEWTAPGDDGDMGQATVYDVRYRTVGPVNDGNFDTGIAVPAGTPRPAGTLERLNVSGLMSETVHWFAIRVGDEVPNWSPVSDSVEILTATDPAGSGLARPPTITGVWSTPSFDQLDVVFSKSMNRSSVMRSLIISPRMPYRVDWANDAHLTLFIQTQLVTGIVYLLTVEPHAADQSGTPMGSRFVFQFMGAANPTDLPEATLLPAPLMIPLLAGLIGLLTGWLPLALLFTRNRRKMHALQGVVVAQAKRIMELRGRILPRKVAPTREVLRLGGRK